jgi:hypothetical protein
VEERACAPHDHDCRATVFKAQSLYMHIHIHVHMHVHTYTHTRACARVRVRARACVRHREVRACVRHRAHIPTYVIERYAYTTHARAVSVCSMTYAHIPTSLFYIWNIHMYKYHTHTHNHVYAYIYMDIDKMHSYITHTKRESTSRDAFDIPLPMVTAVFGLPGFGLQSCTCTTNPR